MYIRVAPPNSSRRTKHTLTLSKRSDSLFITPPSCPAVGDLVISHCSTGCEGGKKKNRTISCAVRDLRIRLITASIDGGVRCIMWEVPVGR